MARDGSGTAEKVISDFVNGTTISATDMNTQFDDIIDMLTQSVSKDGQTVWTGDDDHNGNAIILDADGDSKLEASTDDQLELTLGGVVVARWNTTVHRLVSADSGATGPLFLLIHDSPTPANNDVVGRLSYYGDDSAGNLTEYVKVEGIAKVVTSESERGQYKVTVMGSASDATLAYDATDGFSLSYGGHTFDFAGGNLDLSGGIGLYGVSAPSQASHIADPSGGATVDSEARTAINAILVALENVGITASS